MPADNLFKKAIFEAPFSFTARPEPLAGDLRMSWGISILLLSLFYSHGKKSSFPKLHLLAHSIRIRQGRENVRAVLEGNLKASAISMRIEPSLNRAVALAHGLGMVEVSKGKSVALTAKGKEVATSINNTKDVFVDKRTFLAEVTKELTEQQVIRIWRMEELL